MPIHTQNPNSQRHEYSHSISPLTFIQGKPGEPGNDGVRGPKGSRVSLYCLHNPVVVTERIHEVIFLLSGLGHSRGNLELMDVQEWKALR